MRRSALTVTMSREGDSRGGRQLRLKAATKRNLYTSRIIKAGALLADTKTLLANWDPSRPVAANLEAFRSENLFGKASRSRVEDVLAIFRQRYLTDEVVTRSLVTLVRNRLPAEALDPILYFYSAQADLLLHDAVTEILADLRSRGRSDVTLYDIESVLTQWVSEGKTAGSWSEPTIRRIAQGLLATLRDFGVLRGAVAKRVASTYLPLESFAFIAFDLRQHQPSGERLVEDGEWRLFFLSPPAVERLFMEAHQGGLLEYHAAGPVIRISFPADSLEGYADVISQRAH